MVVRERRLITLMVDIRSSIDQLEKLRGFELPHQAKEDIEKSISELKEILGTLEEKTQHLVRRANY